MTIGKIRLDLRCDTSEVDAAMARVLAAVEELKAALAAVAAASVSISVDGPKVQG